MSVSPKDINLPPVHAPGFGVADALKNAVYSAKSGSVTVSSDTQPALLFNIPKNVRIVDLVIHTTTAVVGADYVVVGTTADTDMFFADTSVMVAGSHSMKYGTAVRAGGYETSTGAQTVTANWSTGASAGVFWMEVQYKPLADENYVNNP